MSEYTNPVQVRGNEVFFHGEKTYIFGRSSFKFLGQLKQSEAKAREWIHLNQQMGINNLRVFGEYEGWEGHPMFGSGPRLDGIWDLTALRKGDRPKDITPLNRTMLTRLYRLADETGMSFEYVIDATLKGEKEMEAGTVSHCIARTLEAARRIAFEYPAAKIIFNFHNEWNAHNAVGLDLRELNRQAMRARRWYKGEDKRVSFVSPGEGWTPECFPEAVIMVDGGSDDEFEYRCGGGPRDFQFATIHPERSGDWWELPETLPWLRSHGKPVFFNESKCYYDKADIPRVAEWYPNIGGLTHDLEKYLIFMRNCGRSNIHFTIHDEKGMQSDPSWPTWTTELEAELGGAPVPKVLYQREIIAAYQMVLSRYPDEEAFKIYDGHLKNGMTWAELVDVLMRSDERTK